MPTRKLSRPDRVIRAAQRRVPLPDSFRAELPQNLHSVAFTVSGIEQATQASTILQSLNRAIENGESFEQWKETVDVARFNTLTEARKQLVFRMHMQTAYNQGAVEYGRANKDRVPYLRYSAVLDAATRPSHRELDGITRPVDDAFWDVHIPPLGFNCRCDVLPITKAAANQGGTRKEPGDSLPEGKGLTPPSTLKSITARPDKGFAGNKRDPLKGLTRYYRRKARQQPGSIQQALLANLTRRGIITETWWARNRSLYEVTDE
jgi:SPP1 gp7 family putative phage head morphogenesis protein